MHCSWPRSCLAGMTLDQAEALLTPEALDAQAWVQIRGSTDGRYVEQDVPIVERGRLAVGPNEVFLTPGILPIVEEVTGHRSRSVRS